VNLIKHDLPRPPGLIECNVVLDVGAGIRPMNWYEPAEHICVEPYGPYADRLKAAGFLVVQATALQALRAVEGPVDAIYLLDVIEHMEKAEALEVIDLAKAKAARQVVVFTPYGFMQQDSDVWGLGGHHWQTHRSGWLPEEFPGWQCERYGWPPFEGFYAVWTAALASAPTAFCGGPIGAGAIGCITSGEGCAIDGPAELPIDESPL
jgi:hypothetical protein